MSNSLLGHEPEEPRRDRGIIVPAGRMGTDGIRSDKTGSVEGRSGESVTLHKMKAGSLRAANCVIPPQKVLCYSADPAPPACNPKAGSHSDRSKDRPSGSWPQVPHRNTQCGPKVIAPPDTSCSATPCRPRPAPDWRPLQDDLFRQVPNMLFHIACRGAPAPRGILASSIHQVC